MMEEKAGATTGTTTGGTTGAAAGTGKAWFWIAGAAAGLAAGAAVWAIALRTPPGAPPHAQAAAPAASAPAGTLAPEVAAAPTTAPAAPAATPAAEAKPAEPAPATTAATTPAPAAEASASEASATTTAAAEAAAPSVAPNPAAPVFDTVRAEADGSVLIAGRAAPGTEVAVLADGTEVARVKADDRGQFVAFAELAPNGAARVLTLQAGDLRSDQTVILAPAEAPVAVASAAPETAPATTSATMSETPTAPAPAAEATSAAAPAASPEPPAAAAPEVLIADAEGVRKMAPAPTEGVVIDTISYAANGDVMLAGRGQGLVRLYLDDGLVAEAKPEAGGWQARLTDVAPGLYRLRADEIAADGKVMSRFETPFQREAPEALIAAASAPVAGAGALPMPVLPAAPPEAQRATSAADSATDSALAGAGQGIVLPALPKGPAPVVTDAAVVTVQPGFTLWRIARENYGDGALYVKVFQANRDLIRNPDLIYPGQVFTVPDR